jgi:hypothetical protein
MNFMGVFNTQDVVANAAYIGTVDTGLIYQQC